MPTPNSVSNLCVLPIGSPCWPRELLRSAEIRGNNTDSNQSSAKRHAPGSHFIFQPGSRAALRLRFELQIEMAAAQIDLCFARGHDVGRLHFGVNGVLNKPTLPRRQDDFAPPQDRQMV